MSHRHLSFADDSGSMIESHSDVALILACLLLFLRQIQSA